MSDIEVELPLLPKGPEDNVPVVIIYLNFLYVIQLIQQ